MYALNFAGIVYNRDRHDAVLDILLEQQQWWIESPFLVNGPRADKAVCSVFCTSIDSTPMSDLIMRLVSAGVKHRIVTAPYYSTRVMESFTEDGSGLVIHQKECDSVYQMDFAPDNLKRWIGTYQIPSYQVDQVIESIVVVGPNIEARKVHRWIDFNFRTKAVLNFPIMHGIRDRQVDSKVYIKVFEGGWNVLHADGSYEGTNTGCMVNEAFLAKLNGFVSHVIKTPTE